MISAPYNLYVQKRPLKIAFIVDPNEPYTYQLLVSLININASLWGGTFNKIILAPSGAIDDVGCKLLITFDPDIIKSFVKLNDASISEIQEQTSPLQVMDSDLDSERDGRHIKLDGSPVSITNALNLNDENLFHWPRRELALPTAPNCNDALITEFIKVNFGILPEYTEQSFENLRSLRCKIDDRLQLSDFLNLIDNNWKYVFPQQLSLYTKPVSNSLWNNNTDFFTVIVGDSPADLIYYWNNTSLTKSIKKNFLWMPTGLIDDPSMQNHLAKFISIMSYDETRHVSEVRFISHSLSKDELKIKVSSLNSNQNNFRTISLSVQNEQIIPSPEELPLHYRRNRDNLEMIRVNSESEQITLVLPLLHGSKLQDTEWMADFYIESDSNTFNEGRLQLFPRRNDLVNTLFRANARITTMGIPSIKVSGVQKRITVTLPTKEWIFFKMFCGVNQPYLLNDLRKNPNTSFFNNIEISDKGNYLSGFISLFGGLYSAYHTLSDDFWLHIFDVISAPKAKDDSLLYEDILSKLKKRYGREGQRLQPGTTDLEKLSEFILRISQLHNIGKDVPYKYFIEEDSRYHEQTNEEPLGAEELKEEITDFIENNILLMGIKPHCPTCGFSNWFTVQQAAQRLICQGCGNEYWISPEQPWYYRLNSLVQAGFQLHGLVPVVLALGKLKLRSRHSFVWYPSINLYRESDEYPYQEVDIVCLIDGQLVIGEVKKSINSFKRHDFKDLADLAEIIRPNKIIFSSMNNSSNRTVRNYLLDTEKRLTPFGIKVEWI